MTVGELRARMSSAELTGWRVWFQRRAAHERRQAAQRELEQTALARLRQPGRMGRGRRGRRR